MVNRVVTHARARVREAGELPPAVRVYLDRGGKFPTGNLSDGTAKRARAITYIVEHIRPDPASLDLWGRVVAAYCAQWSAKSYTVMIQDYYLVNRIPGQPKTNGGNHANATGRPSGLASLKRDTYRSPDPDELARLRAQWDAEHPESGSARP